MLIYDEPLRAPEFDGIARWLNTETPCTLAGLKGKTVLLDFWDYTCLNCLNTLPALKAWHARYDALGLAVVGIHTPEFSFAAEADRVEAAIARWQLPYPVGLDNDRLLWRAYANRAWPSRYLIDERGYLLAGQRGEGGYAAMETLIQDALREASRRRAQPVPVMPALLDYPAEPQCLPPAQLTPELYLGSRRGRVRYEDEAASAEPVPILSGQWEMTPEAAVSAEAGASIRLTYRARDVYLVARSMDASPVSLSIAVDGVSWPPVAIGPADCYRLLSHANGAVAHELLLSAGKPGLACYSLTFDA